MVFRVKTTAEYIEKAIKRHGERFDYSQVIFKDKLTPITVICKDHGKFQVNPVYHFREAPPKNKPSSDLNKPYGCSGCSLRIRRGKSAKLARPTRVNSLDSFIARSQETHGNKYSYEKTVYVDAKTKVIVTCPSHGDFKIIPIQHHYRGRGCEPCRIEARKEKDKLHFIAQANLKHNHKYDYSLVTNYDNHTSRIAIICPDHGIFTCKAGSHLGLQGCKKCKNQTKISRPALSNEDFIKRGQAKHGEKFDYSKVLYKTMKNHTVTIICPHHGEFEETPAYHLGDSGCRACGFESRTKPVRESWISQQWLDDMQVKDREVPFKELSIIVDGLKDNTVYEFYGCFWHGCLRCNAPDKLNTKINLTTRKLNDLNKKRETKITNAGYKLVIKWECDYRAERKALGLPIKPPKTQL